MGERETTCEEPVLVKGKEVKARGVVGHEAWTTLLS